MLCDARRLNGRQEQRNECCHDGDDHEQLHERERLAGAASTAAGMEVHERTSSVAMGVAWNLLTT